MSNQKFHKLRISKLRENTPVAKTIVLEIPEDLKKEFEYQSGQYVTVEREIKGQKLRRSYSLSSFPGKDEFHFTVKKVKGGAVSPVLVDELKPGDKLLVSPPEGRFTMKFDPEKKRAHFFFAAGSGITPVIALIKDCLDNEPMSNVYLLYCNKDEKNVIFDSELNELKALYEGQFFYNKTFTRAGKGVFSRLLFSGKKEDTLFKGRINGKLVDRFLENYTNNSKEHHFYICGPGNMIETVDRHLREKGVGNDFVHKEYFTPVGGSKKEFSAGIYQDAKATVHLHGRELQINIPKNKTVLETLQNKGEDPPYSCTSGVCSTCMAKLIKGKVEMETCLALDDSEVEEGFILTCQAKSLTPELELTYDF